MVSQADDGDAVQCHVALPVAAFVEPVSVGPAAGRGDGADAAEFGERGLASDAFGVVPGDDGQGRGDDGARAVHVEQRPGVFLEDQAHAFLQETGLSFERLPCLGGGFQRGQHAMLDQAAGRSAFGEPVHAGLAPQPPVTFPDGFRGGDEQPVRRIGDRGHRRHQLGSLRVEVAQCLDPAVRAFRQARAVAGHDATGGGDRVEGIGLAVPAAHASPGAQHLAHLVSGGSETTGQGRSERVRALHAHGRDPARPGQHADQPVVSVRVRRERLGAQRPAPLVEQCDGVRVRVGVDPGPHHFVRRRHRRRSFPCVRMPPGGLRRRQDVDGARYHGSCGIRRERPRSYEVMHPWPTGRRPGAGQIKIRTATGTDGVSQMWGHRPSRHPPLSPIRNRHNHYQRQIEVVQNGVSIQSGKAAGFSPVERKDPPSLLFGFHPIRAWVRLYDSPSNLIILP